LPSPNAPSACETELNNNTNTHIDLFVYFFFVRRSGCKLATPRLQMATIQSTLVDEVLKTTRRCRDGSATRSMTDADDDSNEFISVQLGCRHRLEPLRRTIIL